MGDNKAGSGAQNKTQTSKAGDTKNNSSSSSSDSNNNSKSNADNKAGNAGDTKKAESKKLGEMGKLMYGCQSFGS